MAHDEQLLDRVRALLVDDPDVVEKRMVGGRSFSVHGRMCCGVNSAGLVVRVGADGIDAALHEPHVTRMKMGSKEVAAFVVVAPAGVATEAALRSWVTRGVGNGPVMSAAERFASLADQFGGVADVTLPGDGGGRGFGSSALRVGGSIFAMLSHGRLVVKLPSARVAALIEDGTGEAFTAGKTAPMKQWLTLTTEDPAAWLALAGEALDFVRH
jgi:TfoX/Sxy family transcriptional regulator of competence genes